MSTKSFKSFINLDANATYGLLPELYENLKALFPNLLNPNSVHQGGQAARAIIEKAREEIAALIGTAPGDRIIFTSGATESNNLALYAPFLWADEATRSRGAPWSLLGTALEHPSVLGPAQALRQKGVELRLLGPRETRSLRDFVEACSEDTRLVSLMYANNESGEIFDVPSIAKAIKEKFPNTIFHTDAVQALGKFPLSFRNTNADLMSLSAHKIGGLMGAGALIVREGINLEPLLRGGPQEERLRAGTENLLGIASFGLAAKHVRENLAARIASMRKGRDFLLHEIKRVFSDVSTTSNLERVLPNTLSIQIPGVRADDLVVAADTQGVLISYGAACSSGKQDPSHVFLAMGYSEEEAKEIVRISLKAEYEAGELEHAASVLISCIQRMRK